MQFGKNAFHFLLAGILTLGFATKSYGVKYTSGCTVTQIQGPSDNGDTGQLLLKITLQVTNGGGTPPKVNDMTFNLLGFSEMSNVELWTSDQVDDFSGAISLGSQTPGASVTITNGTANDDASNGAHYYWLTCDMNGSISPDVILDAEYVSGSYTTGPPTFTGSLNPAGFRLSDRSYTIGTGENYATVKDAADAIVQFVYDGAADIFMELTANYSNPAENTAILFSNHTGPSLITIRPEVGQTAKITQGDPGSGVDFISFNGVQNIILDGRPGGIGINQEWTLRNSRTAASVLTTLIFNNDASNNFFKYLIIERDSAAAQTPIISISGTSGTTGNDNITFLACHIRDWSVADGGTAVMPADGIRSTGTTGKGNNNIIIDGCHIYNIFKGITFDWTAYIDIAGADDDNWTIKNNHFYQTTNYLNQRYRFSFIRAFSNGGHIIKDNFFGGSAPSCGGSPFSITATTNGNAIKFESADGPQNTISGNTIANISFTTDNSENVNEYAFYAMRLRSTSDFLISNNTVGSTTGTGNLVVTVNNPAGSSKGFVGVFHENVVSSGSCTVNGNLMGSVTVNGTRDQATTILIENESGAGQMTVSNNTLGNTTTDNILVSSDSRFEGISNNSSNGITITNNTIQNCSQTFVGANSVFTGLVNSAGSLDATGNTIQGINNSNNGSANTLIDHTGTSSIISDNSFQDISVLTAGNGSLICINVNSGGTSTISGNTLGSSSDNNMTIAVTGLNYGILANGGGTYTISGNTIQEFNLTDAGTNSSFLSIAVFAGNATVSGNTIQNIDLATTKTSGTYTSGIHSISGGTSQIIRGNIIRNINLTTTTANGVKSRGIFISTGDGLVENNLITGLTNTCTDPTGVMDGILETSGNWNLYNNVIILDNVANTNELSVNGINTSSTGTGNIYHNTVKIAGTTTGGATNTHSLLRTSASGTSVVKNNIFQNIRSGGTGKHYAENSVNTGTYTSDYNYVENITAANLCNYGGTDYNLAGWQGAPVNAANSISGTIAIDASGYSSGVIQSAGTNLTGDVPQDKDGITRSSTPWMGAYEGPVKDKDGTITPGAGAEPVTISSVIDTDGEKILVFDFSLDDLGTSDGLATVIDSLEITPGSANGVADWTKAIAGAELSGPDLPSGINAVINPSSLGFRTGSPGIITIADGSSETYVLKIWLKTDLSNITDNDVLEFRITNAELYNDITKSGFTTSSEESGDGNNAVDITATELRFVTNKPPAIVNTNFNFEAELQATDVNGNLDLNESSSVTCVKLTGSGLLSSVTGLTQSLINGVYSWIDFQYNVSEVFTIEAQSASLANASSISITSQSATLITVGSSGDDYTTIEAAFDFLEGGSPLTQSVIIEVQQDYNDALEILPIDLNPVPGASLTNTITIRPATGVTGLICEGGPGGGTSLFNIDDADFVIIDGRPGGLGKVKEFTLRNTDTPAAPTVQLLNDASDNVLRYLILEGEVSNNRGIVQVFGSINSTGNNDNKFQYCTFQDVSVGGTTAWPEAGIYVNGDAGKSNSNGIIDECHFVGIYEAFNTAGVNLQSNNDNWVISNNHFYYPDPLANLTNNLALISVFDCDGVSILDNFFGGSAPNATGTFSIQAGTNQITGIYLSSTGANPCFIQGNTYSGIEYTTTSTLAAKYPMRGISLLGSADVTIGGAGVGNIFGSTSGLSSLKLTNNAASGSYGFVGVNNASSGTVSIEENIFGGILVDGTRSAKTVFIDNSAGTTTVNNNSFGTSDPDNISVQSNSSFFSIDNASSSGITITNNTFQNWDLPSTFTFQVYNNSAVGASVTFNNNTIRNIASGSTTSNYVIYHMGNMNATVSGNTFEGITTTGTGAGAGTRLIYVTSGGTNSITNNTLGTADSPINFSGTGVSYGIEMSSSGSTHTVSDNVVQNINMTENGASDFFGIVITDGTASVIDNVISNINTESSEAIRTLGLIHMNTTTTGNVVRGNTIQSCHINNTTGAAGDLDAIILNNTGSGMCENNFITNLTTDLTGSSIINGIMTKGASGDWDIFNNVVVLDNDDNLSIYAITDEVTNGTTRIYHNTVKITGAGTGSTYCFYENNSTSTDLSNNLFQNVKTAGTNNYAASIEANGSFLGDNNYLEAPDPSKLTNIAGAPNNLAGWRSGTTATTATIDGTETVDANGYAGGSFVANAGMDLSAIVLTDKQGVERGATPWIGAYETTDAISITPTDVGLELCPGESFSLNYNISGTFGGGNVFTAEISDESGSFIAPIAIGSIASSTNTPFNVTIPTSSKIGTSYRIRVIASDPPIDGEDNGASIHINVPLAAATGYDQNICSNSTIIIAVAPYRGGGSWALTSGSGFIVSPNSNISVVTGLLDAPSSTTFKWTSSFGSCSNFDELVVQVKEPTGSDGTLDFCFNSDDNGGSGSDNKIQGCLLQDDGKIIVVGSFIDYDGFGANYIARLNVDGTFDQNFDVGTGADNIIFTAGIQSDGKILIGGQFTSYNGTARNKIARINADGTLDVGFNPGTGFDNIVEHLEIVSGPKILVAGRFTDYNGTARNRITRLNMDATLDGSFNPGTGSSSTVYEFDIQDDGKIVIVGSFSTYDGTTRGRVARLNVDGTLDTGFDPGTGANTTVRAVTIQNDGKIMIGGQFGTYNGTSRARVARINEDGTLDTSFDPGTGANGSIYSIHVFNSGKMIIGGLSFTNYDGTTVGFCAGIKSDGSIDPSFQSGQGFNGSIEEIFPHVSGTVLVSGNYRTYNGAGVRCIAQLSESGVLDTNFNKTPGADNLIRACVVQPDGKLLVGGDFTSYNGYGVKRLLRLNPDGTMDQSFNPGNGPSGGVYVLEIQSDNKILLGGNFTSYDGVGRSCVARLNMDGSLDLGFNPGAGANSVVRCINIQTDGKIVVGGSFTTIDGVGRNRIARLNNDGSHDTGYDPGSGADGTVYSMDIQPDGKVILGGGFVNYNGTGRQKMARVNTDGSLDLTLDPGTGPDGDIFVIKLQNDGKVFVGGSFSNYAGVSRNYIARVNSDGTLDTGFDSGTGANGDVNSGIILVNDKIIIGGLFTSIDGTSKNRIARLNGNGSLDAGFNPGLGADGDVYSLAVQSDGKIIVAGDFLEYNSTSKSRICRVYNAVPFNLYYYQNSGNWNDNTKWFNSSNGVSPCTCVPDNTYDVIFDANSFTGGGQVITIPAGTHNAKSLDFQDPATQPAFKGSGSLVIGQ